MGEIVDAAADIQANDTSNWERADITRRLGKIYDIRFEIYRRKFFVKFLNNFLAQVTPFFFYAVGGYFAIRGELSIGQLVAVNPVYDEAFDGFEARRRKEKVKVAHRQRL